MADVNGKADQWSPGGSAAAALSTAATLAETAADPQDRRRWLTFALVGAGPTGVELAGQIRELAAKTLRAEYRSTLGEAHDDGGRCGLVVVAVLVAARAVNIAK